MALRLLRPRCLSRVTGGYVYKHQLCRNYGFDSRENGSFYGFCPSSGKRESARVKQN